MSPHWLWWIASAILIGAELITGTFYLLVVGLAVACGGIAAWLGADVPLQWLTAGILGVAGTFVLQWWKRTHFQAVRPQQSLDIGQAVQVQHWKPDGTARVSYRGSTWDAELAGPATERATTMYIAAMRGSTLIVSDRRP
jgi:membrane protein implicated in regulation of membrane protease activity